MDHPQIKFAQWLKQRRKALDMTQKGLASCVGCSIKTIEKVESGERRPSRQIAELLLRCLEVPENERQALLSLARGEAPEGDEGGTTAGRAGRHNLPAPMTSFIGREAVLEAIGAVLSRADVRLVTLMGPPGIGKTRLSLQVGRSLLSAYRDGVYFVPLAAVKDTTLLAPALAQVFGVRESSGHTPIELLKLFLLDKELLLILDNFEQILDGAPLVTELLVAAPGLKALVTSRESLHVYGEHNYAVSPLEVPTSTSEQGIHSGAPDDISRYEAVRLFVERATAAKHDFTLSEKGVQVLAQICRELDGLPLAIELAAARVGQFSVDEMLPMLRNRLDLLAAGPRDLPERQRTLRGAIEWSNSLLSEEDKKLFRTLSVFVGGFTAEAVSAIWDKEAGQRAGVDVAQQPPIVDQVRPLRDKSLLVEDRGSADGLRFRMLETIREYAWELLTESGASDAVQTAHAQYYLEMAESAEPMLAGPEQAAWLGQLSEEQGNLRAAMEWFRARDAEAALRLGSALTMFWYRRGYLSEGRSYLVSALDEGSNVSVRVRGKALNSAGTLAFGQGDYDEAGRLYRESLAAHEETGDKVAMARALNNLGLIAGNQGDYGAAREFYNSSLEIWRDLGNQAGIALSLNNMMAIDLAQGNYESARSAAQESVGIRREMGDRAGLASSLGNLAIVLFALGEVGRATELQEESLLIRVELGDRHGIANCLLNLGELARHQGDYGEAERLCNECLVICQELGDKPGICNALIHLGHLAIERGALNKAESLFLESSKTLQEAGDKRSLAQSLVGLAGVASLRGYAEQAAQLLGAADAMMESIGSQMYPHERRDYERVIAGVLAQITNAAWSLAWEQGRSMRVEVLGQSVWWGER